MANRKIRFWQSINFKLASTFVLLLFLCIEIASTFFISIYEKHILDNVQSDLIAHLQQIHSVIGANLNNTKNKKEIEEANTAIQKQINTLHNNSVIKILVTDNNKIIRAAIGENSISVINKKTNMNDLKKMVAVQKTISVNNKRILINVLPIQTSLNKVPIGAIYTEIDLEKEYENIHEIIYLFLITFGASIILSLVIAVFISRSLTSPIKKMQKQAIRIAHGDYSNKLEVINFDELSQLELSINDLSDQIFHSQIAQQVERERLNSILDNMTDGVIATDFQGKVIIVNEMIINLLNLDNKEIIGKSILSLLDIEKHYTLQKLLEDTPQIIFDSTNKENETILHVTFSTIQTRSGHINGLVAVLHDITEQQKTEQERQQFVSNVSHELRTPLTSIHSYLETLENGAWKDERIAPKFLDVSLNETERMIRMINDLLQLSKIDSEKLPLNLEIINFNHFVNYILDRFDILLKNSDNKIKITRQMIEQTLWVEIDTDKMTQVIDNVLNNALKYSPKNGEIKVTLMNTPKNVLLSVSDNGMGIPKKDLKKIFDRFYRVSKSRSRDKGGSGLGLAISKEIMNALHGHIWAISEIGKGSTLFLTLPYLVYPEEEWK
ncbi:MAG: cell wall metabolism sensor histidine kinase WalK [Lactobacillales bacterium]|jgi:two-component system sensor histidine kinase VicK|nr:cell wall metabolism sensor histidine kinase WalK [Lactobacillales bacterium]